jgi:hypothetical protein
MTMNTPKAPAIWLSETDVRALVQNARRAKDALVALVNGVDAKVEARRATITQSLSDLDVKDRLRAVDASVSKLKADEKLATGPRRVELLREIARYNETAKGAVEFWDSPVAIVLRETIASTKRATIFENLSAAGPVELKGFASLAIAARDKDMAAAVIGRLHAVQPASARPVSPRSVADALVGEVQRELHAGLLEVDSLMQEAILVERMFTQERSGTNGVASVKLALQNRRLAEVNGARIDDE